MRIGVDKRDRRQRVVLDCDCCVTVEVAPELHPPRTKRQRPQEDSGSTTQVVLGLIDEEVQRS